MEAQTVTKEKSLILPTKLDALLLESQKLQSANKQKTSLEKIKSKIRKAIRFVTVYAQNNLRIYRHLTFEEVIALRKTASLTKLKEFMWFSLVLFVWLFSIIGNITIGLPIFLGIFLCPLLTKRILCAFLDESFVYEEADIGELLRFIYCYGIISMLFPFFWLAYTSMEFRPWVFKYLDLDGKSDEYKALVEKICNEK